MDTQTLDTFTNFVEFVKNVDKYKDVVAQFKQATQDHQDALNLLTQGKSLKAYEDSLASKQARLDFERQEFDKATQAQNAVLDQRSKDLNDREEDLNTRKNDLNSKESNLVAFSASLNQKNVEL